MAWNRTRPNFPNTTLHKADPSLPGSIWEEPQSLPYLTLWRNTLQENEAQGLLLCQVAAEMGQINVSCPQWLNQQAI